MAKKIKMIAYVVYTPNMELYDEDENIHTVEDAAITDVVSLTDGEYGIEELGDLTFVYEIVDTNEG